MKSFYQFVEVILGKNAANTLAAMSDMHMENDDFMSWITQINKKLQQYHQYAISMAVMKHGLNRNFLPHLSFMPASPYDSPEMRKASGDTNRRYDLLHKAVGSPPLKGSPFQPSFFQTLGEVIENLIIATTPNSYQGMSPSEAMTQLMSNYTIQELMTDDSLKHLEDEMEIYNGSEDVIPPATKNTIKRIMDFLHLFKQQIGVWSNYYNAH